MPALAPFNPYGQPVSPFTVPAAPPTPVAPASLASALAQPKAPIVIGPESDALAKALLASAGQDAPHTPFEAVGKLAQLWAGNAAEDKYLKAQQERELAPYQSLREALAGGASIEDALSKSNDPNLLKLGLEYRIKKDAPKDAPAGYRWGTSGNLEPIPGGPADMAARPREPLTDIGKIHEAAKRGEISPEEEAAQLNVIMQKDQGDEWLDQPPDAAGNVYQRNKRTGELRQAIKSDMLSPEAAKQKGDIAAAGRSTMSVNQPFETKQDQTVGEGMGKEFLDFNKQGTQAISALNTFSVMENAMKDPNFYSGTGSELVLPLKRAVAAVTGDATAAAAMEAFDAQSKKSALEAMGGSLGTGFSNADRDFVIAQTANLQNTPAGNALFIDIGRKLAQRKIEVAAMARKYKADHGGKFDDGFYDQLAAWSEANPLFPQAAAAPPGAPAAPAAPQRPRATNPQTGEQVEWDGQQWVPVPKQ